MLLHEESTTEEESSAGTEEVSGGADNGGGENVGAIQNGAQGILDEEILTKSFSEPEVFAEIVRRYETAFLRRAERILHHREAAEDVVQDTFTKIYLHGRSFKKQEGASFKSWAYRILFTTALSRYRKERRDRDARIDIDPELAELLGEDGGGAAVRLMQEESDLVSRILPKLPASLARVLELMYWKGLSGEEIAKEEGISHEAARARVHRAKKKFKSELDILEDTTA